MLTAQKETSETALSMFAVFTEAIVINQARINVRFVKLRLSYA